MNLLAGVWGVALDPSIRVFVIQKHIWLRSKNQRFSKGFRHWPRTGFVKTQKCALHPDHHENILLWKRKTFCVTLENGNDAV